MYKVTKDPVASVIGSANGRVYSDPLRQGVQRYHQDLNVSGSINITVAATRVINRGSILGAFQYLGLNDAGEDVVKIDARTLGFYSDLFAPSARSATRLGGTGVATTALKEMVRLSYALQIPHAAIPQETVYVQKAKGPDQRVRLFAELRSDGGQGGIVSGGTSTMSVAPRFTAVDVYDDQTSQPPDLLPVISQDLLTVPSTNAAYRYEFTLSDMKSLRGIIIQTDSDQGEVGDIMTALRLRMGTRDIIGPAQVPWDDLLRGMEFERGGAIYSTGTSYGQSAYLFIGFQDSGRLANTQPANTPNMRFEFNWAQSAQLGVTASYARITFLGLRQVVGVTDPAIPYVI
jgi:hypothetical protein